MRNLIIILIASFIHLSDAISQIPVEIFGGTKKSTFDAMFFRYFKKADNQNSAFLFFSRTRSSVDYKMTTTTNLPTYSLTEAISFNLLKAKGNAPVLVIQLLNSGVSPKAGIQYAHISKNTTIFTWFVSELKDKPRLDHFLLFRYTPTINEKLHLFTQVELVSSFPTTDGFYNLIQRIRAGISKNLFQLGIGSDFSQTDNKKVKSFFNPGIFLRYEFR